MTFVAVPSLPMSDTTRRAWKDAGGIFPRRTRSSAEIVSLAIDSRADFILNLGRSSFNWGATTETEVGFIWNKGTNIYDLLWPGNTRRMFNDLMPEQPTSFPSDVWVKTPGYGGRGKYRTNVQQSLVLPEQWDWQRHVTGTEYRLVTVGERVVQQFRRYGENGNREYRWTRSEELPRGLRTVARNAASRVPGRNVVAWDLIVPTEPSAGHSDGNVVRPLLFEGNTCPGVNIATAERIVREILRQKEELNAN